MVTIYRMICLIIYIPYSPVIGSLNKLTCGALYVYNIKLNIRNSIIATAKVLLFVSLSFFHVINLYATYSPMIILKTKIKTSITIRLPPIIPEYVKNVTTINVIAVNIPIVFASI